MKKMLSMILAVACLMMALGTLPAMAEEQTVINLFYGTDSTGALQQIIDAFEAAYPQY